MAESAWWTTSVESDSKEEKPAKNPITFATFNVLAQVYTSSKYFPYAAGRSTILAKKQRRERCIEEIASLKADVLCLQEVDDYGTYWSSALSSLGYQAQYKRKPNGKRDGVLIAWKSALFTKNNSAAASSVEFDRFKDCVPTEDEIVLDNALPKTNCVALAVPLRHVQSGALVTFATTHIVWRWRLPRLQIAQISRAFELARNVAAAAGSNAIVLAGDFNSVVGGQAYDAACSLQTGMVSVHSLWPTAARGANVTNLTDKFRGWIDHIFFSSESLELSAVMPLPSEAELTSETALPNSKHASDHIPLLVQFSPRV